MNLSLQTSQVLLLLLLQLLFSINKSRELKYIEHSKTTIVVSDVERQEIHKFLPAATIVRISNIHADLEEEITPLPFKKRQGCVFVGNWNHLPNRDAALWFARDILPSVSLYFLFFPHLFNKIN